jgi:hypothetical protein
MTRHESRGRPKTAVELISELRSDSGHLANAKRQEQLSKEHAKDYRRAAAPILDDLETAGYVVTTIGELRHLRSYRPAIPVLLRWLPMISDRHVKEDIVRTLSVPWARSSGTAAVLVDEFKRALDPTGSGLRWAIANGIEVVGDDSIFGEVADLCLDSTYGKAREMLVLALAKMDPSRAAPVLFELLKDEEVVGHAVIALGRLRIDAAREYLQRFLNHPKRWIRREAKKALANLD